MPRQEITTNTIIIVPITGLLNSAVNAVCGKASPAAIISFVDKTPEIPIKYRTYTATTIIAPNVSAIGRLRFPLWSSEFIEVAIIHPS